MVLWWTERADFHWAVLEFCLFIRGTVAKDLRVSLESTKSICLNWHVKRSMAKSFREAKGDKVDRTQTRFFLSFEELHSLKNTEPINVIIVFFFFINHSIGCYYMSLASSIFIGKTEQLPDGVWVTLYVFLPLPGHTRISWFVFWVFREGCQKASASLRTERFGWNTL